MHKYNIIQLRRPMQPRNIMLQPYNDIFLGSHVIANFKVQTFYILLLSQGNRK